MKNNKINFTEGYVDLITYSHDDTVVVHPDKEIFNIINKVENFNKDIIFIEGLYPSSGFTPEEVLNAFITEYGETGLIFAKVVRDDNNTYTNLRSVNYMSHIYNINYFMKLRCTSPLHDEEGNRIILFLHGNTEGHEFIDSCNALKDVTK